MKFSEQLDRRIDEVFGSRSQNPHDFEDISIRRIEGALMEIRDNTASMLEEIGRLRGDGVWGATPDQIQDYNYHVSMLESMVARLKDPNY